jgi:MFS family permease
MVRRARLATFAYFVLNGFVMGSWVARIPVVTRHTGVTPGTFGWLLLGTGGAAFVGMRLFGPLTDRLGARRTIPAAGVLCAAGLVAPGLAGSAAGLAAALVFYGFGNGCLDVAMNTHAVHVERTYGRPIMAAFHAAWSLGGVAASGVAALMIAAGISTGTHFAIVAGLALVTAFVAARGLLPDGFVSAEAAKADAIAAEAAATDATATDTTVTVPATADASPDATPATDTRQLIRRLAALCFAVMLGEGIAYDWSTIHVRDVLHAAPSTAALAYGCFATACTVGRLTVDRVAAHFGPVAVLRYGAATAAVGLAVAAVAPGVPVAIAGWTLAGLGLAGCVPQLFSAAGNVDPAASGTNVSRVAGFGYLGMLAGPALISALTRVVALNTAFLVPAVLCLAAAFQTAAVRVTSAPRRPGSPGPSPEPARSHAARA